MALKTKILIKHLVLIVLSFFVLLILTSIILKLYTRHGKEYIVPKIIGLNINDLEGNNELKHFQIMMIDSLYKEGIEHGTILTQDPTEGSYVKDGRKIYITIASFSGEIVRMPNCKDKGLKSAIQLLVDAGLRVGTIMFRNGEIDGLVVEQRYKGKNVAVGDDVHTGESIDLVVELVNTTKTVRMPDILGKTETDAEAILWKLGLNVGRKVYQGKQDAGHMRVVGYSPYEKYLTVGSIVNINFANDNQSKFNKQIEEFKRQVQDSEIEREIELLNEETSTQYQ